MKQMAWYIRIIAPVVFVCTSIGVDSQYAYNLTQYDPKTIKRCAQTFNEVFMPKNKHQFVANAGIYGFMHTMLGSALGASGYAIRQPKKALDTKQKKAAAMWALTGGSIALTLGALSIYSAQESIETEAQLYDQNSLELGVPSYPKSYVIAQALTDNSLTPTQAYILCGFVPLYIAGLLATICLKQ